ncbi:MAG: protein-tyrosine phosphatase family protein [Myxococcota bacterium]
MKLFSIKVAGFSTVSISERPRPHEWLETDLIALRDAGVSTLVCCLTPPEVFELGLGGEAKLASDLGLAFIPIPIPDRQVPDSQLAFLRMLEPATDSVRSGHSVAAHCRAGIGRSTLVVGTLLQQIGVPAEEALAQIQDARGRPVPDTSEQRQWLVSIGNLLK